jgi:tRNA 2-selenouridine synthase
MSQFRFDITEFLVKAKTAPVIDVRSPVEYFHAHIPGAVNLPLFTNEERSVIGTLYLNKGSSEAMLKGLEIIGPRMKSFAQRGQEIAPGGEAVMYCWRGGMRSNSMAWLLNTAGIKTSTLIGGYKAYRRFVQDAFKKPLRLVVIGGMTGSGKTEVIEILESMGKQVLHLERLANHKGSVFGSVGMGTQPSAEQFENDIFTALSCLDPQKPIFVEDESLAVGNVFIPRALFDQMSATDFIQVVIPVEKRIQSLVESYTVGDHAILEEGVKKIEKRLGLENAGIAIECIRKGDMKRAVEIVLKYYDKIYERSMNMHQRRSSVKIYVGEGEDAVEIAKEIIRVTSNE